MSQKIQPQVEETESTPAKGAPSPGAGVSVAPSKPPTAQQAPGAAPAAEEAAPEPEVDRRKLGDDFNGVDKRKNVVDRRTGLDRRLLEIGSPTGLERRRGPGRRRSDDRRSAEEGEMSD